MEAREVLENVMNNDGLIALATAVEGIPSVRMVSFLWDDNKVYFTSFKGSPKNEQIDTNSKVSFTTIGNATGQCVRVTDAECKLAEVSITDVRDKFVAKTPQFEKAFDMAIDKMELYQIDFKKAKVTLGFRRIEEIEL